MKVSWRMKCNAKIGFACLLLFTWLSGCVSVPSSNIIKITPEIDFRLTPPPKYLISTSFSQLVEMDYAGKKQRFIAQVEFRAQEIVLAAVSASGVPLFDFIWHVGQPLLINQYVPLPGLDINYIIADMQWICWPIEYLQASLQGDDVAVKEHRQENSENWQRVLTQGENIIYTITKENNIYQLEHKQRNYRIKITNLNAEEL